MDYILGKNDCGWYIWSQRGNCWVSNNGNEEWTVLPNNAHWQDPAALIRYFRDEMGNETTPLKVGTVTNI